MADKEERKERPNLRERRRRETRRELVEIGIGLFEKHGFDSTSVGEIAERAGTSVATFYRYFPTKEELVFFDAKDRLASLRAALRHRGSRVSILGAIRDFYVAVAHEKDEGPNRVLLKMRTSVLLSSPYLRGRFLEQEMELYELLSDVVAADLGLDAKKDTVPRFVAGTIAGAIFSTGWLWDTSGELVRHFTEMFELLEEAIGPVLATRRNAAQL